MEHIYALNPQEYASYHTHRGYRHQKLSMCHTTHTGAIVIRSGVMNRRIWVISHTRVTDIWVMSHTWVIDRWVVSHSWVTGMWVMSDIWVSYHTHESQIYESCHTHDTQDRWVVSHTWVTDMWVMSHTWVTDICDMAYTWVMSHTHESCHTHASHRRMSHVTHMSHRHMSHILHTRAIFILLKWTHMSGRLQGVWRHLTHSIWDSWVITHMSHRHITHTSLKHMSHVTHTRAIVIRSAVMDCFALYVIFTLYFRHMGPVTHTRVTDTWVMSHAQVWDMSHTQGLSLSEAESSIVAPFTSSIHSIPDTWVISHTQESQTHESYHTHKSETYESCHTHRGYCNQKRSHGLDCSTPYIIYRLHSRHMGYVTHTRVTDIWVISHAQRLS